MRRSAFGDSLRVSLLLALAALTGCASSRHAHQMPAADTAIPSSVNATPESVTDEIEEQDPEPSKEPTVSSLTLITNEKIAGWIQFFATMDRARFQRFLDRGQKYRKIVEDVLVENDLPPELFFLALIESGYQTHATSSARAVGVWQFMPSTGRRYGLQITSQIDERRDPIRATEAAAKYLRDLYNIFGSWPLAMAAYNAGEYGVIRSILKGKSRDYWTLVKMGVLPKETSDYVAKMMAAATIGADPDKYGFTLATVENYPELEAIGIPPRTHLSDLAKHSELSLEKIREFNPHLKGNRIPNHPSQYEIWFPKENAEKLHPHLTRLQKSPAPTPQWVSHVDSKSERTLPERTLHRVKAGENLTMIAKRYGTSTGYLVKVNSLSSSSRIYPGMKLRITSRTYQPQNIVRYRVKKGENLDRIARKFGLSARQVQEDNSLKRSRIVPGQILVIRK